jgi:hypothetical protein
MKESKNNAKKLQTMVRKAKIKMISQTCTPSRINGGSLMTNIPVVFTIAHERPALAIGVNAVAAVIPTLNIKVRF